MANSVDPDQTAVCSGPTLFASILNTSVRLGNYLQQTTFSDACNALYQHIQNSNLFKIHFLALKAPRKDATENVVC